MLYLISIDLYTEKVEIKLLRRNTDKTILATKHPVCIQNDTECVVAQNA